MIRDGEELLRAVDREGTPLESAFWMWHAEEGAWALHLQSSKYPNPLRFLQFIQSIGKTIPRKLALTLIVPVSPESPLPHLIGVMFRTDPQGIQQISSWGNSINGVILPPMLIYRNSPLAPTSNASQNLPPSGGSTEETSLPAK